jgi:hypothetical protein
MYLLYIFPPELHTHAHTHTRTHTHTHAHSYEFIILTSLTHPGKILLVVLQIEK